jgi:hypothetical protein
MAVCSCGGAGSQNQALERTQPGSLTMHDSILKHSIDLRVKFLRLSDLADTEKWTYDNGNNTWRSFPKPNQGDCLSGGMVYKNVYIVKTVAGMKGYELSHYQSGRVIPIWDEDLLELDLSFQCEYLAIEYDFENGTNQSELFTADKWSDHAITMLLPIPITSTQADSILSAWGIQDRMHPRDGELMGIEGAHR